MLEVWHRITHQLFLRAQTMEIFVRGKIKEEKAKPERNTLDCRLRALRFETPLKTPACFVHQRLLAESARGPIMSSRDFCLHPISVNVQHHLLKNFEYPVSGNWTPDRLQDLLPFLNFMSSIVSYAYYQH